MDELPPLPEPFMRHWINCPFEEALLFTGDQMRAYAAAAVAAERERNAKLCDKIENDMLDHDKHTTGVAYECAAAIRSQ